MDESRGGLRASKKKIWQVIQILASPEYSTGGHSRPIIRSRKEKEKKAYKEAQPVQ